MIPVSGEMGEMPRRELPGFLRSRDDHRIDAVLGKDLFGVTAAQSPRRIARSTQIDSVTGL